MEKKSIIEVCDRHSARLKAGLEVAGVDDRVKDRVAKHVYWVVEDVFRTLIKSDKDVKEEILGYLDRFSFKA